MTSERVDWVTFDDRGVPVVSYVEPRPEMPIVYVVAYSRWDNGPLSDYGGASVFGDGYGESFGHVSSNLDWLRNDTTVGFDGDRRARLRELYPDGFKRVVIDLTVKDAQPPEAIAFLFTKQSAQPEPQQE